MRRYIYKTKCIKQKFKIHCLHLNVCIKPQSNTLPLTTINSHCWASLTSTFPSFESTLNSMAQWWVGQKETLQSSINSWAKYFFFLQEGIFGSFFCGRGWGDSWSRYFSLWEQVIEQRWLTSEWWACLHSVKLAEYWWTKPMVIFSFLATCPHCHFWVISIWSTGSADDREW